MIRQLLLLIFIAFFIKNAIAVADCGLSTINLDNQDSVLSVQKCLKSNLSTLEKELDSHSILVDKFKQKAQSIINSEALCIKYEEYYRNADNPEMFKTNVDECYAMLNRNTKKFADFSGEYKEMKNSAKIIKQLILALENKYNMLSNQLEFLK